MSRKTERAPEADEGEPTGQVCPIEILCGVTCDGRVRLSMQNQEFSAGVTVDLDPDDAEGFVSAMVDNIKTARIIQEHGGFLSEMGNA